MNTTPATRWRALRVRAVVAETHDAMTFAFELAAEQVEDFRYRPGQFLTLRLPVAGRHLPRCYSLSSAPMLDDAPRITVKRVSGGRGSNWLCDHVQPGAVLEVAPPAGVFTPSTLEGDFLLLAAGSGITPVYSILRSVLAQSQGRITLLYANRDERSVIFRRELAALAAAHPARLVVIHWLDSVQGVPSAAQLAALAAPSPQAQAQAFVCGPGPFMDAGVAALRNLGVAEARIHVERFVSLPEEDPAATVSSAPAPVDGVDEAEVTISHQGQLHRITCGGSESILDAALRVGLALPHACQAGLCASCTCQVTEGRVHLRANEVLDQKDLSRGWTLACQAVPTTARVQLRFAE